MRPLQPLPIPASHTPLATVADLKDQGVAHWRLHHSGLPRAVRGVAMTGDPSLHPLDSLQTRIAATRLLLSEGQFLSRRTAALEYGMPLKRLPAKPEVGALLPRRPPRRQQLSGHQIRAGVLRQVPDAPLWQPHPADAWGLLAAVCSRDELVMSGDFLLSGSSRFEEPLCERAELEETTRRFKGGLGIAKLVQVLPLLRTGVESPAESLTRLRIVDAGLPEPQTCVPVRVVWGIAHADLGYPQWKIAIEYEGAYHFGGLEQARKDNERVEAMRDADWRVLRVTAIDLRDPRRFLARLAAAIREAQRREGR